MRSHFSPSWGKRDYGILRKTHLQRVVTVFPVDLDISNVKIRSKVLPSNERQACVSLDSSAIAPTMYLASTVRFTAGESYFHLYSSG